MGPRWFSWIFTLENKGMGNYFWFPYSSLRRPINVTPLIHACILQVPQTATITACLGAPCMSSLAAMGHLPIDTGTLTRLNLWLQPHKDYRRQYWCREWGEEGTRGVCSGRGVHLGETRGKESPSSALMTTLKAPAVGPQEGAGSGASGESVAGAAGTPAFTLHPSYLQSLPSFILLSSLKSLQCTITVLASGCFPD